MRKFALATAAAAALLFTAPSFSGVTTPAEAATTVVKKKVVVKHGDRGLANLVRHGDRGRHHGLAPLELRRQEGRGHQEEGQRQDRDQEEDHARLIPRDLSKRPRQHRGRFAGARHDCRPSRRSLNRCQAIVGPGSSSETSPIRNSPDDVPLFPATKARRTARCVSRSPASGHRSRRATYVLRHNAGNRRRTCTTTHRSNHGRSKRTCSSSGTTPCASLYNYASTSLADTF